MIIPDVIVCCVILQSLLSLVDTPKENTRDVSVCALRTLFELARSLEVRIHVCRDPSVLQQRHDGTSLALDVHAELLYLLLLFFQTSKQMHLRRSLTPVS